MFITPLLGLQSLAVVEDEYPVRGQSSYHRLTDPDSGAETVDTSHSIERFTQAGGLRVLQVLSFDHRGGLRRGEWFGCSGRGSNLNRRQLNQRLFERNIERQVAVAQSDSAGFRGIADLREGDGIAAGIQVRNLVPPVRIGLDRMTKLNHQHPGIGDRLTGSGRNPSHETVRRDWRGCGDGGAVARGQHSGRKEKPMHDTLPCPRRPSLRQDRKAAISADHQEIRRCGLEGRGTAEG